MATARRLARASAERTSSLSPNPISNRLDSPFLSAQRANRKLPSYHHGAALPRTIGSRPHRSVLARSLVQRRARLVGPGSLADVPPVPLSLQSTTTTIRTLASHALLAIQPSSPTSSQARPVIEALVGKGHGRRRRRSQRAIGSMRPVATEQANRRHRRQRATMATGGAGLLYQRCAPSVSTLSWQARVAPAKKRDLSSPRLGRATSTSPRSSLATLLSPCHSSDLIPFATFQHSRNR